ncbi:YybS family protein [Bacillus taeanensis]|uniref:DUF2232 domain-containing protein n=1 Tax=Bacillus taeanensis TaxID=273032 RepID=A0A366XTA8_9BACI|nr:DUF2232 domain-containing protein [Bacillus taeanensis]RBW69127.1 DUF2232 domain-containing protein [Bacillus taeanensis]
MMKKTNLITEAALLAAIYTIFFMISFYVPLLNTIVMWVLPLPFIFIIVRHTIKAGMILWAVTLALTLLFSVMALPLTLLFGSGGIVMGALYKKRKSAFAILLGGSLTYIAGFVLLYIASILFLKIDIMKDSITLMKDSLERADQFSKMIGGGNEAQLQSLYDSLDVLQYLAPSALLIVGVLFALLTQLVANMVLKRFRIEVPPFPPFREWSFPKSFLWYYLGIILLSFVSSEVGSPLYIAAVNLILILENIMIIQGITVIFYFSYLKKWPKAVPVMAVIFSFLLALPLQLIKFLGIIDLGFNLRKRMKS